MKTLILGAAFVVALTSAASAQAGHESHMQGMKHSMSTPCPLHLTTLGLTAPQQAAFDSVAAQHRVVMGAIVADAATKPEAKRAAMEASMKLSVAAARALLDAPQRALFDANLALHEQEMKEMQAKGQHDCLTCCEHCDGDASMKPMMPMKPMKPIE